MQNSMLIFLAAVLALTGCNRTSPSKMVLGEGQVKSDDLSATSGNLILKEGAPGIEFAFVTKPGKSKEFTYFVVFNHDFPQGGIDTRSNSDGLKAHTLHTITAFGNDCKVEYDVKLKEDRKTVDSETTTIADAPYDPAKGKFFLIDIKTTPPTVTQLNPELPSQIPDLSETEAAEKFGQDTLNGLRKTNKQIDEFCKQIETKGP